MIQVRFLSSLISHLSILLLGEVVTLSPRLQVYRRVLVVLTECRLINFLDALRQWPFGSTQNLNLYAAPVDIMEFMVQSRVSGSKGPRVQGSSLGLPRRCGVQTPAYHPFIKNLCS